MKFPNRSAILCMLLKFRSSVGLDDALSNQRGKLIPMMPDRRCIRFTVQEAGGPCGVKQIDKYIRGSLCNIVLAAPFSCQLLQDVSQCQVLGVIKPGTCA